MTFEGKLHDLRGRRISAVHYWDVHNFSDEPAPWDYGDWHHAVMGVELTTDRGPACVVWSATFYPYGVEVFHGPITDEIGLSEEGPERVGPDPADPGPWAGRLNSPVRDTTVHWERMETRSEVVDLPWAFRLDFDAGPVWFLAAMPQFPDTRRMFVPADEIVVVFSRETLREFGFGQL